MRAAEYIRMSTDYQQYSTANQQAKIREFAALRGIEVVRTYLDEGRSGLRLKGRPALQALLADVAKGTEEYDAILVYDVSRWGRFQDLDEGAHYEFICRSAGKSVVYCAEMFGSDSSPFSSVIKGLRRVMAGEYSRELSERVFASQCRLIGQGYKVGGAATYGYRRLLLDTHGRPKGILGYHERKAMQNEHVVLIPGPDEEVEVVREIFRWFVEDRLFYSEIADRLERSRIAPPSHVQKWTKFIISHMLSDEKYIGNLVYNKTSSKLRQPRKKLPESEWLRHENAVEPLVPLELFKKALRRKKNNPIRRDPVRAERQLKALLARHGRISTSLMRQEGLPDRTVYEKRFGSLLDAYTCVGYFPDLDYARIKTLAWASRRRRGALAQKLVGELRVQGALVTQESECVFRVGDQFRLAFSILSKYRKVFWKMEGIRNVDLILAVRFSPCTSDHEYFLLPRSISQGSSFTCDEKYFEQRWGNCLIPWEDIPAALLSGAWRKKKSGSSSLSRAF